MTVKKKRRIKLRIDFPSSDYYTVKLRLAKLRVLGPKCRASHTSTYPPDRILGMGAEQKGRAVLEPCMPCPQSPAISANSLSWVYVTAFRKSLEMLSTQVYTDFWE